MKEERKAAFIGGTKGPWILTEKIPEPRVRVKGLTAGKIYIEQSAFSDGHTIADRVEFSADGEFEIPNAMWTRVCYEGPCRSVLCFIINRVKRDAVQLA